ncbi:MAG: oxygen-independent coproporphyrinogen III oxidase [Pseudomonadales bacterium]|nr:oxygen-independent coproporphyrinogen III oxidase [Pseudomonadales bacterium]
MNHLTDTAAESVVDLDLIRKYNVNGPRYTSYPTALQFDDLNESAYKASIQASDRKDKDLSLYFHIPFCNTICYYCACSKIVTRDKSKATRYLAYLKREIALQAPLFAGRKVTQLHWGGGTPTFISDDEIADLMSHIRHHFSLADDTEGEFSIEIDPRTVDAERIGLLRRVGFNRLSFGVQDFNPLVQKAVNRLQSYESTCEVIEAARANGFRSVSVDLIYGLPYQDLSSISETLDKVIAISPDRISIYNYAHLPERFKSQRRIDVLDIPSADLKLNLLKLCTDKLVDAGYCFIGMDHFAKPEDELAIAQREGTLHRNFQGYSTFAECDMAAMGVTAISQVGRTYAQNVKTLEEYEAAIDAGQIPVQKGVEIDADDLIRKAVIMDLICQFRLRFNDIESAFGIDFGQYFSAELLQLETMAADGLLTLTDDEIEVSRRGRMLIRNICMVFDRYMRAMQETQRFSKAI